MYNKHLDSFLKVAETGSFSAAAEQMFISRAALIQQINLLEEHTGLQLFVRHSKGVNLTLAGEQFLTAARSIIYVSNRTIQRCQEMQGSRSVRIGMLPNIAPHFLPKICREFTALHPDIQVQFIEFPLEHYFRSFQDRKFDITMEFTLGFIYDTPKTERLLLAHDVHCLGIPPAHPFAKKKYITEEDLTGRNIVMFPQGTSKADNALREHLMHYVKNVNIIDTVSYDRSLPLKCELSGWFLVYYARYPENFLPLVPVPLKLSVKIPIDIGLGYHTDSPEPVRLFLEVAKKYCQKKEKPAGKKTREMENFKKVPKK